jgi:hypothetical protein
MIAATAFRLNRSNTDFKTSTMQQPGRQVCQRNKTFPAVGRQTNHQIPKYPNFTHSPSATRYSADRGGTAILMVPVRGAAKAFTPA